MIPEDKVAEVRDRTDLVALVREYVALKRSGTSYKGLCPFHGEKTSSFYVHPDRGFFHCFGCQVSGDAITFLMRIDGHSFPDATQILAERCGVEITVMDSEEESAARRARTRRERLFAIVDSAAGFFVKMMNEHTFGPMAWAELSRRGIGEATAQTFRLGYAPHGWDELATFLGSRGYSPSDCEEVGLIVARRQSDGHYDRFRHRLMFPVTDSKGRIVAFSGRALEEPKNEGPPLGSRTASEPPAKYINSPETTLYKKGEILFGLHEARVELRRSEIALVCEGNFDVVGLAEHGFKNVLAPLGTAFTPQQAKLLRRYVSTAVLIFDADSAGRKAVWAAQPLLAKVGLATRVVTLPSGADPDSFVREKGPEALDRLIKAAPSIVDYIIDSSAVEAGGDAHAIAVAISALGPVLMALDNPVEARLYIERIAAAFEVRDIQAVRQQLRRGAREARGSRRRSPAREPVRAPEPAKTTVKLPEIETRLVGAFLDHPALHESGLAEKVHELLTSHELRAIFALTARWVGARGVDAARLLGDIEDGNPTREWLERRLAVQEFEEASDAERFVERAIVDLERRHVKWEKKRLSREILAARRGGDEDLANALMRERVELDKRNPRIDRESKEQAPGGQAPGGQA